MTVVIITRTWIEQLCIRLGWWSLIPDLRGYHIISVQHLLYRGPGQTLLTMEIKPVDRDYTVLLFKKGTPDAVAERAQLATPTEVRVQLPPALIGLEVELWVIEMRW